VILFLLVVSAGVVGVDKCEFCIGQLARDTEE